MGYFLEFKDGPGLSVFSMAPETALNFFKSKGLKPTFSYLDMVREEHDAAFTVAKMLNVDLLGTVSKGLDKAVTDGWSIDRFRKELKPILQSAGWWGQKDLLDPLGNLVPDAQLGSAYRLNTIYRSNLQSSYSVGQWERIEQDKERAPWLLYDAVDDQRTREEHAKLDNTVLPVDDPFWSRFMPPNGYNCRCGVIQLTDADLERMGLEPSKPLAPKLIPWKNPRTGKIEKIPAAIDPGWDHNPGKERLASLQKLAAEKISALPPEWQERISDNPDRVAGLLSQQAAEAWKEIESATIKAIAPTIATLTATDIVHTISVGSIEFDAAKNTSNIEKHGLSLEFANELEWDTLMATQDRRKAYDEVRMIGYVLSGDRLYCVVYTDRDEGRRIISLRKANTREVKRYASQN